MARSLIELTRRKLEYVRKQIAELSRSDFPHSDGSEALGLLEAKALKLTERISLVPNEADSKVVQVVCHDVQEFIQRAVFALGMILRSTNVRNSFEIYDPIKKLCRAVLGPDARLILSSEWDYSPMTFPITFPELPKFAFIGMPASESDNALVIPLAGHEIGHHIWWQTKFGEVLREKINASVREHLMSDWARFRSLVYNVDIGQIDSDLWVNEFKKNVVYYGLRKCEEVFCDVFSCRVFGEPFLAAFEYLLSPRIRRTRDKDYPSPRSRVTYVTRALTSFGIPATKDYARFFAEDPTQTEHKGDPVTIDAADNALADVFPEIVEFVRTTASTASLPVLNHGNATMIKTRFSLGVPADGAFELCDIVYAGWLAHDDDACLPALDSETKYSVINELTHKSIEVAEFRRKVPA